MNAPAQTPTPGRVRGFQRGTAPASVPTSPAPADAVASSVDASSEGGDPASPEQATSREHLVNIDWDEAANHSSAGLHRGEITAAKINGKGTGVWVGVRHCRDNTLGGLNFMIWREEKGKLDPKTGKPIRTPDAVGRKAWANFCRFFELAPGEVMEKLADVADNKIPATENPLLGVTAMFMFKDGKDANAMPNATLDEAATLQMRTTDDAG